MHNKPVSTFLLSTALLLGSGSATAAERFVSFHGGDVLLNPGKTATAYLDPNDCRGVGIAMEALTKDFQRTSGSTLTISSATDGRQGIIVGTLGHSARIDQLARQGKIDVRQLRGKREKFIITTVDGQLVIAGSDRRGTIYGIYELSEQMGVSPWYDWADVPVQHHDSIFVNKGTYTDGEPAVRYRGIFINDEAPCFTSWVRNTYGTDYGDHRMYARIFELILRLRGNMMWPAMWGWAFYADDPENEKTADEMGIVMSTSHHEPMARNHQEYARNRQAWGAWNYNTNRENLQKFFREGIQRMKGTEQIVTIGMRGDGDEAMSDEADTKLMQQIIADQRKIIAEETGRKASETPQVWALYKEVLDYYDKGMKVPDDVTLLLCDDNWGNVRRVPNAKERKHPGGWGLYYHVDYVGAPRNTKFLNVTPVQNQWEQLTLAYENGIDRLWILNVGDLKPMECPIDQFMKMAWNPRRYTVDSITDHTVAFCRDIVGDEYAEEAARILNLCCKYNGRCTAEMLKADTYDLGSGEWQKVVGEYLKLEADALRLYAKIPAESRDAYREIILFPTEVMSNLHQMYYAQAMNQQLYRENNPMANEWADRCEAAFRQDSTLCAAYNTEIAGGKWNGMMTQKHISYTDWNDAFERDVCPELHRITAPGAVAASADGVINIEAPHYASCTEAKEARWTKIPFMGKSLAAMTLMPYTAAVDGASLTYQFKSEAEKVKVHVVTKSTLDYLNKGGLTFSVSIDGGAPVVVNFNKNLNEKPENIYDTYYPTIARRVVDSEVEATLQSVPDGIHTITITPHDPAIVFEKIVIDTRKGNKRISHL